MSPALLCCLRLLLAAAFGAVIGLERQWRAKEAGLRTHYLVAMASCLFMLVSKFGFADLVMEGGGLFPGTRGADSARIAASVVSGISFLGAGVIVLHKHFVLGLTSAATVWTTAAIGLAVGGGLYPVAAVATLLVVAGLEVGRVVDRRISRSRREARVVFTTTDDQATANALKAISEAGARISSFSSAPAESLTRIHLLVEAPINVAQPEFLLSLLARQPGCHAESVE